MEWLKKFLNFEVDLDVNTEQINKSIYTLGAVSIVVILIYNYTK